MSFQNAVQKKISVGLDLKPFTCEHTTRIATENFPERSAFWSINPEAVALSSRNYPTPQDIQCKDEGFDASKINASVSFHWLITFTAITNSLEMWQPEHGHWPKHRHPVSFRMPFWTLTGLQLLLLKAQVFYSSNVTSARLMQMPWTSHQDISNYTG